MKRDIRINFGVIDDVITNISDYYDALSDIDISLRNIKSILGENTGKSIDSLTSNYDELTEDIEDCKSELSEVKQLLSNYLNEMGSYIQPVYRSSIMQVDRNDVWANLHSIENSVMGLVQSIAHSRNNCAGSFTFDEEKVKNERANYEIIEGINSDVNTTLNKLNSKIDELWNIYNNKIVPFENTDDAFKGKAKETYSKIAGFGDIVGDFFSNFGESAGDIFSGFVNSIFDLVKGVVSLIKGAICYLGSTVVVLVSQPFGDNPSWAKDAKDYFNNTNNLIGNILDDPMIILEGMVQEASDIIDQKGICYSTGYVAGMIAGTKGLDKIAKATKGLIINEKTPNIKVADEVVNQASNKIDDFSNKGIKGASKYRTKISNEMEKKILEAQRKSPTKNEVIGGHSPNINNNNSKFAVEELAINPDGTKSIKFIKDFQDGSISKIKKSTIFPDSWNDSKIIDSIKKVGDSPSISVRARDGATWHRQIIDGVEIDVIKIGDDVVSGYPTGKTNAPKPSGF